MYSNEITPAVINMDNSEVFKYCPRCGKETNLKDSRKIVCGSCGFELYLNNAAAVAALIFDNDGRLLVLRRNCEPKTGMLDLPGGFVDFGEDANAALTREVREELNIGISDIKFHTSIPNTYEYAGVVYHTLDLFFTCRAESLPTGFDKDEIMEILYIRPNEISESEIAFDSMKNLIKHSHLFNGSEKTAVSFLT